MLLIINICVTMTILENSNNYSFFNCFIILLLLYLPTATSQTYGTFSTPPPDPFGNMDQKFDPSMAIIMIVLITVFFFMGFFTIYIRQCARRRHFRSRNTVDPYVIFMAGNERRSRRVARGLDASVIDTFPTFVYSAVKGLKIGKLGLECAVCLNEFEDDETLRLIPKCSHVFHPDCIDAWLASHSTCPVCRANLVPDPDETTPTSSFSAVDVQLLNPGTDSVEPEQRCDQEVEDVRTRGSRSNRWRLGRLFPRSNSTGHSLGENYERFTLRLPEDVRSELLSRSKSCVAFPRVRSSRRGFRCGSGGSGLPRSRSHCYYERFNSSSSKMDRFGISMSMTPPFIFRTGSVRTSNEMLMAGHEVNSSTSSTPLKNTFKSDSFPDSQV